MASRALSDEIIKKHLETDPVLGAALDAVYAELGDSMADAAEEYHNRHMTASLGIVTVYSQAEARRIVKPLRGKILNKTVVEIGAGVGYVALELAKYSPNVFAIESDPAWSWLFTKHLYANKPPHLTWIFGRAENVANWLRADVAIIVTHSGHEQMQAVAWRIAPVVIDVHNPFAGSAHDTQK